MGKSGYGGTAGRRRTKKKGRGGAVIGKRGREGRRRSLGCEGRGGGLGGGARRLNTNTDLKDCKEYEKCTDPGVADHGVYSTLLANNRKG